MEGHMQGARGTHTDNRGFVIQHFWMRLRCRAYVYGYLYGNVLSSDHNFVGVCTRTGPYCEKSELHLGYCTCQLEGISIVSPIATGSSL